VATRKRYCLVCKDGRKIWGKQAHNYLNNTYFHLFKRKTLKMKEIVEVFKGSPYLLAGRLIVISEPKRTRRKYKMIEKMIRDEKKVAAGWQIKFRDGVHVPEQHPPVVQRGELEPMWDVEDIHVEEIE